MLFFTKICLPLAMALPAAQEAATAEVSAAPEPVRLETGLIGRVRLPDGSPVADLPLELRGMAANDDLVRLYGRPENWEDQVVVTDAEGRFRFEFDPHPAFQFFVEGEYEGYAPVRWRMSGLDRDAFTNLGDAVLGPAHSLAGFVLDGAGHPLAQEVRVRASGPRQQGLHRDSDYRWTSADPTTGSFAFDDLPSGEIRLSASPAIGASVDGPSVALPRETDEAVLIAIQGPDRSRMIEVTTFQDPYFIFSDPEPGSLFLILEDGSQRVFEHVSGSSQSLAVEDVPEGDHRVRVEDSRFHPVEVGGVRAGAALDVNLVGNAAVELRLTGPDGQPSSEAIEVRTRFLFERGQSWSPDTFTLQAIPAGPGQWTLEGLIPVPQELHVRSVSGADLLHELRDLAPNERRPLELPLAMSAAYAGRLLDFDGAPVADCEVQLVDISNPSHPWPPVIAAAETDSAGRFELLPPKPGPVRLVFTPPGQRRLVFLDATEFLALGRDPDVWLPQPGRLVGDLRLPPGPDGVEVELHLERLNELTGMSPYNPLWSDSSDAGTYTLGGDNRYEIDRLGPGTYLMWLSVEPNAMRAWTPAEAFRRFELSAGETERIDLDFSGGTVGSLELRLLMNGQPPVTKRLILTIEAPLGPVRHELELDADGTARLQDLPTGRARVQVMSLERQGDLIHLLEPFDLEPAASRSILQEWSEPSGRLRVLDADGDPLLKTTFNLGYADQQRFGPALTTMSTEVVSDADGWIELELLEGAYRIKSKAGGAVVEFEWSAAALAPRRELEVGR